MNLKEVIAILYDTLETYEENCMCEDVEGVDTDITSFIKENIDAEFIMKYFLELPDSLRNHIILNEEKATEFIHKYQVLPKLTYHHVSKEFLIKFKDKIDINYISETVSLPEEVLRSLLSEVDWRRVSIHQKLSENFIREFQDRVDWRMISIHQKLSENFIREFQDRVDWERISAVQSLSESFIMEFKHKVNWFSILRHKTLSEEFLKRINDKLSE